MLAVVWHFWIAPILVGSGVLLIIATIVGYLNKVSKPRYAPKKKS